MWKKILQNNIVVFIVLVMMFMIPNTYAIFRNRVLGNGSLALATWDVALNQTNVSDHLSIIPSPNESVASYTVNVTNVSEVSITYVINIDNLPTGVSVSLDGGEYVSENNHKVVFSSISPIAYNASNKNRSHVLSFKASSNATFVNNAEVNINVVAKQQV